MLLNINNGTFIIYVVRLTKQTILSIYLFHKVQVTLLIKTKILFKYFNFSKIFFLNSAMKMLEKNGIKYYYINLLDDK